MARRKILMVDDEARMLEVWGEILRDLPGTEVLLEPESQRALARLQADTIDLLITDIGMPGLSGVELLRLARQQNPRLMVLMLTGSPTVDTAVECMKLGAAD